MPQVIVGPLLIGLGWYVYQHPLNLLWERLSRWNQVASMLFLVLAGMATLIDRLIRLT